MITLTEVDPSTTIQEQLGEDEGPIVLVNTFIAPDGERDAVVEAWSADAAFMTSQPGCLSAQLHEGIGRSHALVNVAVWESTAALRKAFNNPEFRAAMGRYPDGTVASPHAYRKVAVEGICGD